MDVKPFEMENRGLKIFSKVNGLHFKERVNNNLSLSAA